jgi:hypothetical protein
VANWGYNRTVSGRAQWLLVAWALVLLALVATVRIATAELEEARLTWYGEAFRGGPLYCDPSGSVRYNPDDPTVVATAQARWRCGDVLEVCGTSCVTVTVLDRCGGCMPGQHVDLSRAAWQEAGGVDYGTVRRVEAGGGQELSSEERVESMAPTRLPSTGAVTAGNLSTVLVVLGSVGVGAILVGVLGSWVRR